jgi:hypothetical protein
MLQCWPSGHVSECTACCKPPRTSSGASPPPLARMSSTKDMKRSVSRGKSSVSKWFVAVTPKCTAFFVSVSSALGMGPCPCCLHTRPAEQSCIVDYQHASHTFLHLVLCMPVRRCPCVRTATTPLDSRLDMQFAAQSFTSSQPALARLMQLPYVPQFQGRRRKATKKVATKKKQRLSTMFKCPFCAHELACEVKMYVLEHLSLCLFVCSTT